LLGAPITKEAAMIASTQPLLQRRPAWWHPKGAFMRVHHVVSQPHKRELFIKGASDSFWLNITSQAGAATWYLQWQLYHEWAQQVTGKVRLATGELCLAFALQELPLEQDPLISRYRQWVCRPGCFFRLADFLNIPCRGTGQNGDPNMSLLLTPEIKTHLANLIAL